MSVEEKNAEMESSEEKMDFEEEKSKVVAVEVLETVMEVFRLIQTECGKCAYVSDIAQNYHADATILRSKLDKLLKKELRHTYPRFVYDGDDVDNCGNLDPDDPSDMARTQNGKRGILKMRPLNLRIAKPEPSGESQVPSPRPVRKRRVRFNSEVETSSQEGIGKQPLKTHDGKSSGSNAPRPSPNPTGDGIKKSAIQENPLLTWVADVISKYKEFSLRTLSDDYESPEDVILDMLQALPTSLIIEIWGPGTESTASAESDQDPNLRQPLYLRGARLDANCDQFRAKSGVADGEQEKRSPDCTNPTDTSDGMRMNTSFLQPNSSGQENGAIKKATFRNYERPTRFHKEATDNSTDAQDFPISNWIPVQGKSKKRTGSTKTGDSSEAAKSDSNFLISNWTPIPIAQSESDKIKNKKRPARDNSRRRKGGVLFDWREKKPKSNAVSAAPSEQKTDVATEEADNQVVTSSLNDEWPPLVNVRDEQQKQVTPKNVAGNDKISEVAPDLPIASDVHLNNHYVADPGATYSAASMGMHVLKLQCVQETPRLELAMASGTKKRVYGQDPRQPGNNLYDATYKRQQPRNLARNDAECDFNATTNLPSSYSVSNSASSYNAAEDERNLARNNQCDFNAANLTSYSVANLPSAYNATEYERNLARNNQCELNAANPLSFYSVANPSAGYNAANLASNYSAANYTNPSLAYSVANQTRTANISSAYHAANSPLSNSAATLPTIPNASVYELAPSARKLARNDQYNLNAGNPPSFYSIANPSTRCNASNYSAATYNAAYPPSAYSVASATTIYNDANLPSTNPPLTYNTAEYQQVPPWHSARNYQANLRTYNTESELVQHPPNMIRNNQNNVYIENPPSAYDKGCQQISPWYSVRNYQANPHADKKVHMQLPRESRPANPPPNYNMGAAYAHPVYKPCVNYTAAVSSPAHSGNVGFQGYPNGVNLTQPHANCRLTYHDVNRNSSYAYVPGMSPVNVASNNGTVYGGGQIYQMNVANNNGGGQQLYQSSVANNNGGVYGGGQIYQINVANGGGQAYQINVANNNGGGQVYQSNVANNNGDVYGEGQVYQNSVVNNSGVYDRNEYGAPQ